jgi:predicted ATPase
VSRSEPTPTVWLVELAPLSEGVLVAQAVAAVLEVKEQPDRSLTDALVCFLRAKRALLTSSRS